MAAAIAPSVSASAAGKPQISSTASTISTPVFNERYLQYFEQNPEKLPTAVIIDKEYLERNRSGMGMILEWIQRHYNWEEKQESEFLYLIES